MTRPRIHSHQCFPLNLLLQATSPKLFTMQKFIIRQYSLSPRKHVPQKVRSMHGHYKQMELYLKFPLLERAYLNEDNKKKKGPKLVLSSNYLPYSIF